MGVSVRPGHWPRILRSVRRLSAMALAAWLALPVPMLAQQPPTPPAAAPADAGALPEGATPVPPEAAREWGQQIHDTYVKKAEQIEGPRDAQGRLLDPNGQVVAPTVAGSLVHVQEIVVEDLTTAASLLGDIQQMTPEQKAQIAKDLEPKAAELRKAAAELEAATRNFQAFLPSEHLYNNSMALAAKREQAGDAAGAQEMRDQAAGTPYGRYLAARAHYTSLLNATPILGLKKDGVFLYDALADPNVPRADLMTSYLAAGIDKLHKEAAEKASYNTIVKLAEFAGEPYRPVQDRIEMAGTMIGSTVTAKMMAELRAAGQGPLKSWVAAGLSKSVDDFLFTMAVILAVGSLILPGGPMIVAGLAGIAGVQIVGATQDYRAASAEHQGALDRGVALGYAPILITADRLKTSKHNLFWTVSLSGASIATAVWAGKVLHPARARRLAPDVPTTAPTTGATPATRLIGPSEAQAIQRAAQQNTDRLIQQGFLDPSRRAAHIEMQVQYARNMPRWNPDGTPFNPRTIQEADALWRGTIAYPGRPPSVYLVPRLPPPRIQAPGVGAGQGVAPAGGTPGAAQAAAGTQRFDKVIPPPANAGAATQRFDKVIANPKDPEATQAFDDVLGVPPARPGNVTQAGAAVAPAAAAAGGLAAGAGTASAAEPGATATAPAPPASSPSPAAGVPGGALFAVSNEPCGLAKPQGTFHTYSECNKTDGYWYVITDEYYRCPHGVTERRRVSARKTDQRCTGDQAQPPPPESTFIQVRGQNEVATEKGHFIRLECQNGFWWRVKYIRWVLDDGSERIDPRPIDREPTGQPCHKEAPPPVQDDAHRASQMLQDATGQASAIGDGAALGQFALQPGQRPTPGDSHVGTTGAEPATVPSTAVTTSPMTPGTQLALNAWQFGTALNLLALAAAAIDPAVQNMGGAEPVLDDTEESILDEVDPVLVIVDGRDPRLFPLLTARNAWTAFRRLFQPVRPSASVPGAARMSPTRGLWVMSAATTLRASAPAGAAVSSDGPQVQMLVTSLGTSTGEAFEAQVVNNGPAPVRLDMTNLVLQPLKKGAEKKIQQEFRRIATGKVTKVRLNGYCLELLKQPPVAGTLFRVAPSEVQRQFEPARRIFRAGRQLLKAGGLQPDSDPRSYFHWLRQWAIWTHEQGFDEAGFQRAFLEHTKKGLAEAGRPWTKQVEQMLLAAAPHRWQEIQEVLAEAGASR